MIKKILFIWVVILCSAIQAQEPDIDDMLDDIKKRFGLQDYIGSVEACDRLIGVFPKNGDAFYYRAHSKFILGDLRGATIDLKSAKSLSEDIEPDKILMFWTDSVRKTKQVLKSFYKNEKVYPELGFRPKYGLKDTLRGKLRDERTCFDVTHYYLDITINQRKKHISGSVTVTFKVVSNTSKIQLDLFKKFKISTITWNGTTVNYERKENAFFVSFPNELQKGETHSVIVTYSGKPISAPNPPWDGGFVWEKDNFNNYWSGVACERLGASSWWPCKDHMSDEADSVTLAFTVPLDYLVVSNGRFRKLTPATKGFVRHEWFVSNPINNYNITFYLGKYIFITDTFKSNSGKLPLEYYVLPNHIDEANSTFEQTKEILTFYEKAFGEFPFMTDKFCFVESPYEGMEHQGAIAFGNNYNKGESGYINKKYDYIIVHEAAHEWWGNSLSVSDMAEIWIQEGFATFSELLLMEKVYGYDTYLKELKQKEQTIYNFWPLIQNYDVNENGFASNDCYNKGAAILNNLRCCINNDTLFYRLIKDFSIRYKKKIVTNNDFVSMVNDYTGNDYTSFFKKFLFDKNLPVLVYSYQRDGKNMILKYKWDEVDSAFTMPIGINTITESFRLNATTQTQEIILKDAATIRFYTNWLDPENVKPNSYTYYWTRCEGYK